MRSLLLAALLVTTSACSSHPRIDRSSGLTARATILRVEPAAQAGSDGALACLAMLLRAHGAELDGEAVERFGAERILREGLAPGDLRDYLRGRGLPAEVFRGDLSLEPGRGVLACVRRGTPVALLLGGGEAPRWVILHGFDERPRWALVVDPAAGARVVGWDELDASWAPTGRVTLVTGPAAPAPPSVTQAAARAGRATR
jgi:ABC-type bacteriocin/lantibiotic exporter with double-glycine peptidase domain